MKKNELRKWRENYTPFNGTCFNEGIRLNVHFEEKDFVKDLGAKWQPDASGKGGYWWMPAEHLSNDMHVHGYGDFPAICNVFDPDCDVQTGNFELVEDQTTNLTVLEWLNRNQMIEGSGHGLCNDAVCDNLAHDLTPCTFYLKDNLTHQFDFYTFGDDTDDLVRFTANNNSHWLSANNARTIWDELVRQGAVRQYEKDVAV